MYTVETLAITGKWVPKDGEHKVHSFFSASVETFEARLKGYRSRIRFWGNGKTGEVLCEVPPKASYISPREFYSRLGALRKLKGETA